MNQLARLPAPVEPGTPQRKKEITDYARIISGQSDPDLQ